MSTPAIVAPILPPGARLRQQAARTIRRLCEIPERLTVTEWADRYRVLPETSTAPGRYRSSVVPYHRRPQDLLGDPSVSMVALCWASQTGKSTVLENGLGYRIHKTPSPIIVLRPKIDDAESWAKERLVPMVLATEVLRARVRLGRSTDSTLRYKTYPGGSLSVVSAQSATELASRSAPVVLCDEVDRMEVIPGEGNPVVIISRRQAAADIGLFVATSTPRLDETTLIWPYLEEGTYELFEVPCAHCASMQPLRWAQLKWPRGKPHQAEYACISCDQLINEREKTAMLGAGDWTPTNAEGRYPSFHLNALYSPFGKSGWGSLADEFERAHGKPADLQVFVNTRLAETWTETGSRINPDDLADRLEPALLRNIVPDGAAVLTAGLDVQQNRIEVYVWAWGAGLESWPIAAEIFPGDTGQEPDTPGSVWQLVRKYLRTAFVHVNGRPIRLSAALFDSGFQSTKVYRFAKALRRFRVYATKGMGAGAPLLGKPTLQTKRRYILYPVGTHTAKDEFLRSQLLEAAKGPGFVHLPEWFAQDEVNRLAQLTAEVRKRRVNRGRVTYVWEKRRHDDPNEALDCRILARAALELPGMPAPKAYAGRARALARPLEGDQAAPAVAIDDGEPAVEGPSIEPEDGNEEPEGPSPPPAPARRGTPRRPRGGGFVNSWRR